MITALLAATIVPVQVDAGALLSKMFAYYYEAKSVSGTISMSQTMGQRKATIMTRVQFEFPAKFYLRQDLQASYGNKFWLVTGDGVGFTYNPPYTGLDERAKNRLYEPVQYIPKPSGNKNEKPPTIPPALDCRAIYAAVVKSIGDRSLPLDIAFARTEDLKYIKGQLATYKFERDETINGVVCHLVSGDWRDYGLAPVSGKFNMWVTDEGQLKRFARKEFVGVTEGQQVEGDVITVWDVNLAKDSGVDPALFKIVY
ncbi:MAG: hypothetical protein ABL962_14150 [Fimbriimonadaceae bacterium]